MAITMTLQAVIFDLDGVIVDSEPLQRRAFNQLLVEHGVAYEIGEEEYGEFFVGVSVEENAKWLSAHLGLNSSADQIRVEQDAIYMSLISDPKNLVARDGLYALLDRLQTLGLTRGVATGSPRHQVEIVLRGLKIEDCFRAVVTGSEASSPKPDPEIYLRAVQALQVEPRYAIALEDSGAGIGAAKAAGLKVIAVPNEYTKHQDLSHADARAEDLTQVIDIIEKMRP